MNDLLMTDINLPPNCSLIYSNQEIINALNHLAETLNIKLANDNPVVLCVMQGGLLFSGQLIPKLNCMLEIDYIHVTRYNNNTSGGDLVWKAYPVTSLKDRSVLILDDILDQGNTLQAIIQYCEQQGAAKIMTAVLLRKKHDRCIDTNLTDNVALTVEDKYVFGFGMDYNGQYRQLDSIYALDD
ncbi:MAG: hypoxanthine-guanine phosphoribosyltransferase [Gammaproteobacteria bacterium]|nr:hypoxanthine-guanine phosphoribosyltransferase [Gammaproteobacteria bacterium]